MLNFVSSTFCDCITRSVTFEQAEINIYVNCHAVSRHPYYISCALRHRSQQRQAPSSKGKRQCNFESTYSLQFIVCTLQTSRGAAYLALHHRIKIFVMESGCTVVNNLTMLCYVTHLYYASIIKIPSSQRWLAHN